MIDMHNGQAWIRVCQASGRRLFKWARAVRYSLESAGFWDHTLSNVKNTKLAPIDLKDEDLNDAKLERQENRAHKIKAWNKSNSKCKWYLGRMRLDHIRWKFQNQDRVGGAWPLGVAEEEVYSSEQGK